MDKYIIYTEDVGNIKRMWESANVDGVKSFTYYEIDIKTNKEIWRHKFKDTVALTSHKNYSHVLHKHKSRSPEALKSEFIAKYYKRKRVKEAENDR